MALLAQLRERGLRVVAQGDALLVEPRSALTDELRAMIRANKPQLLRELASGGGSLPADLERRIQAMARRWEYSPEELADVLDCARRDPAIWTRAVALDERSEAEFRQHGLLPRADA